MLHHIVGPLDDEMTPSPAELQSEDNDDVPDLPVTAKQTKNVDMISHCSGNAPSKKSTSSSATVTSCSKDEQHFEVERPEEHSSGKLNIDVPLKQRLRSAKVHKSDAASGGTSGKGIIFLM